MSVGFDVVDFGETDHPEPGETAPDFERPLVNGEYWEDTALSKLTAEGPVLLVFHPMDGDFPATYIWNELRDRGWDARGDVSVVGLSISTPYEHARFIDEREIDAPLFSDPGNEVAASYGIVHELDGMAGISEPRPAAFLVDGQRTIQYAWVAREWPDIPDFDAVAEAIDAL